jgi:hypothetical protein
MRIQNEKGIALVISLLIIIVLLALTSILVLRTVTERRHIQWAVNETQAFYIAEAGGNASLDVLDDLINNQLKTTLNNMSPSGALSLVQTYIDDGVGFLLATVKDPDGNPLLTQNGSNAEYSVGPINVADGTYSLTIVMREKSNPITIATNTWDFPFQFSVEAQGDMAGLDKTVLLNGDFTIRVQKDNFAKFALFTNEQETPGGTNVWFTDNTHFDGPVHTNRRFNFALNPSGTFNDQITQTEQRARFYNHGYTVLLDADHNGTRDVPTFNNGFSRGEDTISLSSLTQQQDMIDQVTAGSSFTTNGIHLPRNGTDLSGGIYIKGDSDIDISVDGNNNAVYNITQGSTSQTITVDRANNQTVVDDGSTATTYTGVPDGVDGAGTIIYVDGTVNSVGGTVQEDTGLTIATENHMYIQDDLVYANYTPGSGTPGTSGYVPPSADGTDNLLGLVSWGGNVYVGNAAPDDVHIHGTVLSKEGIFTVDDYDDYGVGPRGTATLLGGVITDNYGAFGLFNGSTGQSLSGYGRNFVYDQRMQQGSSPPYFPTLSIYTAFSNDITDKIVWQETD